MPLPFPPRQVGVFSPSHRNHYLNVTPNNLLRVYSPDGFCLTSTPLPPLVLVSRTATNIKPVDASAADPPAPPPTHPTLNVLFLFPSRSRCCCPPSRGAASPGSRCLGCSWCLTRTRTTRRGAHTHKPPEALKRAPATPPVRRRKIHDHRTQAGVLVSLFVFADTAAGTDLVQSRLGVYQMSDGKIK